MSKKLILTLSIIAVISVAGIIFARANPGQSNNETGETSAPSPTASQSLAASATVYDVRTPEEYQVSHVEDAILLPLSDIQSGLYPTVEKTAPIAVYCRSGNRSATATQLLRSAGYSNVTDLGGIDEVEQYGLSLTS